MESLPWRRRDRLVRRAGAGEPGSESRAARAPERELDVDVILDASSAWSKAALIDLVGRLNAR
jgi:hypothetical protein